MKRAHVVTDGTFWWFRHYAEHGCGWVGARRWLRAVAAMDGADHVVTCFR